jgi:hypothetical protein
MNPPCDPAGPLPPLLETLPICKVIFMAQHSVIEEIRPEVEAMFEGRASLTTAIPGMLEVGLGLGFSFRAQIERMDDFCFDF